jgi:hypothetical protein
VHFYYNALMYRPPVFPWGMSVMSLLVKGISVKFCHIFMLGQRQNTCDSRRTPDKTKVIHGIWLSCKEEYIKFVCNAIIFHVNPQFKHDDWFPYNLIPFVGNICTMVLRSNDSHLMCKFVSLFTVFIALISSNTDRRLG